MAISQLYPNQRPTLNLNFARSKALNPRITFTRNSTATYVGSDGLIKTATAGEARFDHNGNGDSLGLLLEESRTNYITDNSTLTGWGANSATAAVVASTTVCPDGSTDGIRITGTLASDGARKYFTAIAGAYIGSCYARSRTGSSQDVKVAFSGLVGPTQTLPASGEWVRIQSNSGVSIGAGNRYLLVAAVSAGTLDIDVWGEQVEIGSFPTSFIPTSGSTVTRAADVCEITGTNFSSWYSQSEGTVYSDNSFAGFSSQPSVWTLKDGLLNSQNYISLYGKTSGQLRYASNDSNVNQWRSDMVGAVQSNTFVKTACTYKTNDIAFSVDGASPITDATATITTALDRLHIGRTYGSVQQLSGTISRIAYYNTRLSDTTLEALTK